LLQKFCACKSYDVKNQNRAGVLAEFFSGYFPSILFFYSNDSGF